MVAVVAVVAVAHEGMSSAGVGTADINRTLCLDLVVDDIVPLGIVGNIIYKLDRGTIAEILDKGLVGIVRLSA